MGDSESRPKQCWGWMDPGSPSPLLVMQQAVLEWSHSC